MNIPDVIQNVVDTMKVFSTSSFTQVGSSAIYNVVINARDIQYWHEGAKCYVIAGGITYYCTVTAINTGTNTLTISENNGTAFNPATVTQFGLDINWKHGHPSDVFDQLNLMAQHPDYKARRFPVIALMQDVEEDLIYMDEAPVQVILGIDTQAHFTATERYAYSFTGRRLTKLAQRFIAYLETSPYTYFRRKDATKIDRLYWGKDGALGNDENKADDLIDAIELNLNLKILNTC